MNETNNKQEEQKGEKVKRRTSLKNIIGGDILATDFFRRQTKLLVLIMVLILFYIQIKVRKHVFFAVIFGYVDKFDHRRLPLL